MTCFNGAARLIARKFSVSRKSLRSQGFALFDRAGPIPADWASRDEQLRTLQAGPNPPVFKDLGRSRRFPHHSTARARFERDSHTTMTRRGGR
jgi:hypothetical protein